MSDININLGDAFLLETPPNGQHLFIAIAPTSNNKYLFVNLTKRRNNSESACILIPATEGMPSFITHESVIAYKHVREMGSCDLTRVICKDSRIPKCQFPANILSQIQQGGIKSKQLPKKEKKALKQFLGIS